MSQTRGLVFMVALKLKSGYAVFDIGNDQRVGFAFGSLVASCRFA
jgi:hypothetical protein